MTDKAPANNSPAQPAPKAAERPVPVPALTMTLVKKGADQSGKEKR